MVLAVATRLLFWYKVSAPISRRLTNIFILLRVFEQKFSVDFEDFVDALEEL